MVKSRITIAVIAALALSYGGVTFAQSSQADTAASSQNNSQSPKKQKATSLKGVTVTGSLIPQTEIETSTPVTTITAADIKARGFSTVAEALQATSFATGSVQGQQQSAGFTQGAETLSLFGLKPGYVKYLIDGRPMGNFPALYNGSDVFNNIAGIPADMVDHIDILPGGQSSLYGSDAIAGVINIVLKKHLDAPTIDARYGFYTGGGGKSTRLSAADSWTWGKFNLLAGIQYDSSDPIWGYDRSLTRKNFTQGRTPQSASYDAVEYSLLGSSNYLLDPSKCANDASLFGGTTKFSQASGGQGPYCGSAYDAGYKTITNRKREATAYAHATFDVTDNFRLYSDLLYSYKDTRYTSGSNYTFWSSAFYTGPFYDPNAQDIVAVQKVFAPEETGGYSNTFSKQYDNSLFFNFGGNGTFGQSNWDYDVGLTHSEEHLTVMNFVRFFKPVESYFAGILGPSLGLDPSYNYYPVYSPDYTKFYSPISASDFNSFTGRVPTRSKTWDNLLRAQITNSSLFSLPGGDAGLALVAEGGNSGWDYTPSPLLLNGGVWGQTDLQGSGHRTRNALTAELRLPVLQQVTLDLSGRRDSFKAADATISKSTYNIGLEYRPVESLLLRGRYGTAFKAPTLSDQFQGKSGYYSSVADYYNCAKLGYGPAEIDKCPTRYSQVQFAGSQSGNVKLRPISAKVWSYGVVWAPTSSLNFSVDYFHISIKNEVNQQSATNLSLTEYQCRVGLLDATSPTCVTALAQVTRDSLGNISSIYTPKVNVSSELTNNIIAHATWRTHLGNFGDLLLQGSYSDNLKHTSQQYPGDPNINYLDSPYYSSDFKTKANATATWSKNKWSASLYVNRYGSSPNYYSGLTVGSKTSAMAGKLAPWILYNASVRYEVTPALQLSLLANNLFNAQPPLDRSYTGSTGTPYNTTNYNVYGRAIYFEANYKFGK